MEVSKNQVPNKKTENTRALPICKDTNRKEPQLLETAKSTAAFMILEAPAVPQKHPSSAKMKLLATQKPWLLRGCIWTKGPWNTGLRMFQGCVTWVTSWL